MNRFIKNIATLTLIFVAILGIISCETDLENIESGVLKNDLTSSGEVTFEVKIDTLKVGGVRADNIDLGTYGDYWLGSFRQNEFSKSINAGFVSQLNLPTNTNLVTTSEENSSEILFFLDHVVLKLPYSLTPSGALGPNGEALFNLDSILKTNSNDLLTKIGVYENTFFLNRLIPEPGKTKDQNSFKSNFPYFIEDDTEDEKNLLQDVDFSFIPSADSIYHFFNRKDRTTSINSLEVFRDSIVLNPRDNNGVLQNPTFPFLAIPLDLEEMEKIFWNEFGSPNFSNNKAFQDYFEGIIVLSEDENGILVPFNLNNSNAQLSFIFSEVDISGADNVITYKEYNFTLGGVTNAIYDMSPAQQETPSENFIIQGTDGINAKIEILGVNLSTLPENHPFLKYVDKDKNGDGFLGLDDLKDFKDEEGNPLIIINDASLKFLVDKNVNSNLIETPQRLHIYRDRDSNGLVVPANIGDSFQPSFQASFNNVSMGGVLNKVENQTIPDNYTFKLTEFISNFVGNSSENEDTLLVLKVFNEQTDEPVVNGTSLRLNVDDYNWNPRSVVLYNETANSSQKAKINIKFTELK